MSVASHLAVSPEAYDRRIRELLPYYDDVLSETARALRYAQRPVQLVVDLGIGTGALTARCLTEAPRARVWGIDADAAMLEVAAVRLGRLATRVTRVSGSFLTSTLPACDAIVATYALHHIRTGRAKQAFYRRCHAALRPGGVLVSGDCFPASNPRGHGADLDEWLTYLASSCGGRAGARRTYRSWAAEDVYVPLASEQHLLARAGFEVDVPWRRSPFGVLVGLKPPGRSSRRRRRMSGR